MAMLYIQDVKCGEMYQGKTRQLSPAFKQAVAEQLSPKLMRKVKLPEETADVYDRICLSAGKYSGYEVYKNGISALPFRIETRREGTWVGECHVIWKSLQGKTVFAPWDEMKKEDIECGLLIDRKNIDALNRAVFYGSDSPSTSALFGVRMAVYGQTMGGTNEIRVCLWEKVSSAVLLEMAYLTETFAREHHQQITTKGWPRQKNDYEISMTVSVGKGQDKTFCGLLQRLEEASFDIRSVKITPLPHM